MSVNEIGIQVKIEEEIKRLNVFQRLILNTKKIGFTKKVMVKNYLKYIFKEGSKTEKPEVLANLRSGIIYKDKNLSILVM